MTRYLFGMIAVISLIGVLTKKLFILNKLLISFLFGCGFGGNRKANISSEP